MAEIEGSIGPEDHEKILASATDYIESWLDGDAGQMARCLHPELVKRSVEVDSEPGLWVLDNLTREEMVVATGEGHGLKYGRPYEVSSWMPSAASQPSGSSRRPTWTTCTLPAGVRSG